MLAPSELLNKRLQDVLYSGKNINIDKSDKKKTTIECTIDTKLTSLEDVNINEDLLTNNNILRYDQDSNKWINSQNTIDELDDVQIMDVEPGQLLLYDNNEWINKRPSLVENLSDVVIDNAQNNNVLTLGPNNVWVNSVPSLNLLDDLNLNPSPSQNDILLFKDGKWSNQQMDLDLMQDVNISNNLAEKDFLTYTGGEWTNKPLDLTLFNDINLSNVEEKDVLYYRNNKWVNVRPTIDLMDDVDMTSMETNGALIYVDGKWQCKKIGFENVSDLTITSPSVNDTLVYDEEMGWKNQSMYADLFSNIETDGRITKTQLDNNKIELNFNDTDLVKVNEVNRSYKANEIVLVNGVMFRILNDGLSNFSNMECVDPVLDSKEFILIDFDMFELENNTTNVNNTVLKEKSLISNSGLSYSLKSLTMNPIFLNNSIVFDELSSLTLDNPTNNALMLNHLSNFSIVVVGNLKNTNPLVTTNCFFKITGEQNNTYSMMLSESSTKSNTLMLRVGDEIVEFFNSNKLSVYVFRVTSNFISTVVDVFIDGNLVKSKIMNNYDLNYGLAGTIIFNSDSLTNSLMSSFNKDWSLNEFIVYDKEFDDFEIDSLTNLLNYKFSVDNTKSDYLNLMKSKLFTNLNDNTTLVGSLNDNGLTVGNINFFQDNDNIVSMIDSEGKKFFDMTREVNFKKNIYSSVANIKCPITILLKMKLNSLQYTDGIFLQLFNSNNSESFSLKNNSDGTLGIMGGMNFAESFTLPQNFIGIPIVVELSLYKNHNDENEVRVSVNGSYLLLKKVRNDENENFTKMVLNSNSLLSDNGCNWSLYSMSLFDKCLSLNEIKDYVATS